MSLDAAITLGYAGAVGCLVVAGAGIGVHQARTPKHRRRHTRRRHKRPSGRPVR